jgi:hypothetical protein
MGSTATAAAISSPMQSLRNYSLGAFFLLVVSLASAAEQIAARAFWAGDPDGLRYDGPLEKLVTMDVVVQLKNVSQTPLTVFLKKQKPFFAEKTGAGMSGAIIVYRVSHETGIGGVFIKPSIVELMPVELARGEVTEFRFSIRIPAGVRLDQISFQYEIDLYLANRFSAWAGRASCAIQRQTMHIPEW